MVMHMSEREDLASGLFACDDRERALFEAGIKMGTLYHQFVGTPVNGASVAGLEKAMSEALEVQPYVEKAVILVDRTRIPPSDDTYSYASLTGDMMDAVIAIRVGNTRVVAEMRYNEKMDYPLMYISDIETSS